MSESIIRSLRHNAIINCDLDKNSLESYLNAALGRNRTQFISKSTDTIEVISITRLSGGIVNDVYLISISFSENNKEKSMQLVIKFYLKNPYLHDTETQRCMKESEALVYLEHHKFPAPKVYLTEFDSRFLGNPFIIMAKFEKSEKTILDHLDKFADALASLHQIKIEPSKLKFLKHPKKANEFAFSWSTFLKNLLRTETKHSSHYLKLFNVAINQIESQASKIESPTYSLIHGDLNLSNSVFTTDSQIIFTDWETASIGDPAFDVAHAYLYIKFYLNPKNPDSATQIAERFLSQYIKNAGQDIRLRLEFYILVILIGQCIISSSGLSSPLKAIQQRKNRVLNTIPFLEVPLILAFFPFLRWSFFARRVRAEQDILWLKYFEKIISRFA